MDDFELDVTDFDFGADQPVEENEEVEEENADTEVTTEEPAKEPAEESEVTMEQPATEKPAEPEVKPEADQLYELKHLDDVRKVSLDEMRTLAQKGLDYDRVKGKVEQNDKKHADHEEFLKEMADGKEIDEFIDTVRARRLAQKDSIDESTALEKIKLQRERAKLDAEKEASRPAPDHEAERRRNSYVEFAKKFPGMASKDIPNEVWTAHQNGDDLTVAYLTYQNKSLAEKAKILEQNLKNAERSAGSMKSAGHKGGDELDALWDDILKN